MKENVEIINEKIHIVGILFLAKPLSYLLNVLYC